MNWVAKGRIPDEHGYNNICMTRDQIEAVISYKNGDVILINPRVSKRFKDFIELERWLASTESNPSKKLPNENNAVTKALLALAEVEESAENIAFSEVKQQVEALIRDAGKTKHSINEEGVAPRDLVLLLITNVI